MLNKKAKLILLLLAVFCFNSVETLTETWLKTDYRLGLKWGHQIIVAFQQFENNYSFENHDATNIVAVYGYSIAYYFFLPLLGLLLVISLARRKDIAPFQAFSIAVAIDYALSLPFFLFFPVPERWTSSDSAAILLSDRWSSRLIESIRPISGLDNSFPSFHVSMTVVIVLTCLLFQVRFRLTSLILGILVILSTFVLGIHWLPDILAGFAVGTLSALLAKRFAPAAFESQLQKA